MQRGQVGMEKIWKGFGGYLWLKRQAQRWVDTLVWSVDISTSHRKISTDRFDFRRSPANHIVVLKYRPKTVLLCRTKRVISGFCTSDIWSVISNTNETSVAVPDNLNIYFAHRMLLATDKYFSKPHYIHFWPKNSKSHDINIEHHACIFLPAWIHWDLGLNHSLNLI